MGGRGDINASFPGLLCISSDIMYVKVLDKLQKHYGAVANESQWALGSRYIEI